VPVVDVQRYMKELVEFLDARHPEIGKKIVEKKQLDDEVRKLLDAALVEFKDLFQPTAQ
jgi:F-type H+-transporting ATPase subunit alpha